MANTLKTCTVCGLDYYGAFVHNCRGYRLSFLDDGTPLINGEVPRYRIAGIKFDNGEKMAELEPANEAARLHALAKSRGCDLA